MVVSTVTGNTQDTYKQLKATLPDDQFLEVEPLSETDAAAILKSWYQRSDHRLTTEQLQYVLTCFNQSPCPLYLRTAFSESLRWRSYSTPEETKLAAAVKNIASIVFGRMEKQHGETLTRRCLGYITAAKCGVSATEIEDLVSIDELAMDEVMSQVRPPHRRLPTMLWLRMHRDLREHLAENADDNGCTTLQWKHAEFREAAVDRYLKQRDKAPSYHRVLAEYFSDSWSDKPKPFGADETGVRRHVVPQPLYWVLPDPTTGGSRRVYNRRRLVELPYNLLNSQQHKQLKTECLCNYDFVLAKITSLSLRAVFDDLRMALNNEPADAELKLLSDMLYLSTDVLLRDPGQFGSQVIGRLHDIIASAVTQAPGDPAKYPAMKVFLERARHPSAPTLLPAVSCLVPPGGILYDFLSGHTQPITAVTSTIDGQKAVTTSMDDTMKVWEMRSGRVTKSISGVGRNTLHIRVVAGGKLAVTSEKTCIRLWSLSKGVCISTVDQYEDPATLTTAGDDKLVVGFFQGSNMMRTWSICGGEMVLQREVSIVDKTAVSIHKDESVAVSMRSHGQQVLYAFRGTSEARVRNAVSGKLVHSLHCPATGCITAVATSPEYFVCAAKSQLSRVDEIYTLELFDVKSGKHVRAIRGCVCDIVAELWVNQLGSHAISVCTSSAKNCSEIAVWNLETEEHKHLARHAGVSQFGACADLRFCMTAVRGESTLRVWNIGAAVNVFSAAPKPKDGLQDIVPMTDDHRYVVAKSVNNGALRVFDVSKSGECKEKGERVSLADVGGVVLIRNGTVVVLADKGFSSVSDEDRSVYQSITMYDLMTQAYTRQLKDCFIVPSPPHEYVLLDEEHLMGVSDNRNHFVIWSLTTGQMTNRIKNNFRSMDRRRTNAGVRDGAFGSVSLLAVHDTTTTVQRHRGNTAKMTPWDRRTETSAARHRRHLQEEEVERQHMEDLHREKSNAIEQFLISDDMSTIVASYYGHHLCVFDVPSLQHIQTLENPSSMLLLHVATLSRDGSHLLHANYDDDAKLSYVTVWNSHGGYVKKRLRNEKNVCAVAMTDEAKLVVIAKTNNELRVWRPGSGEVPRKICGYVGLNMKAGTRIYLLKDGDMAVVFAGDISVWDLVNGCVVSVFTPDVSISCLTVAMEGTRILFGLYDKSEVVTLSLIVDGRDLLQHEGDEITVS